MANSRSSRSAQLADKADVTYSIDTPFTDHDAQILLIERGEDRVEVIVGEIPTPIGYNLKRNEPAPLEDESDIRYHTVAEWIVDETTRRFSEYDWETSEYKTNSSNFYLRDIYFTCSKDELDEAVLTAKKFITELEEKTLMHAKKFDRPWHSPSDDL